MSKAPRTRRKFETTHDIEDWLKVVRPDAYTVDVNRPLSDPSRVILYYAAPRYTGHVTFVRVWDRQAHGRWSQDISVPSRNGEWQKSSTWIC